MTSGISSSRFGSQTLVDFRLDLLDRLLFGIVPTTERLEIIRRTQERIAEMLTALDTPEPCREQVLEVLSRLEPPEALLPTQATEVGGPSYPAGAWGMGLWGNSLPLPRPTLKSAKVAGGLGIASLLLLFAAPFLYTGFALIAQIVGSVVESEIVIYAVLGAYLLVLTGASITAITTAFVAMWQLRRRRGTYTGHLWATAGLLTALVPFGIATMVALYIGANLENL